MFVGFDVLLAVMFFSVRIPLTYRAAIPILPVIESILEIGFGLENGAFLFGVIIAFASSTLH